MIALPIEYEKTKYPGYFWNMNDKKLYSIKSGVLKPLVMQRKGYWYPNTRTYLKRGYYISHKGIKHHIGEHGYRLVKRTDSLIPVYVEEPLNVIKLINTFDQTIIQYNGTEVFRSLKGNLSFRSLLVTLMDLRNKAPYEMEYLGCHEAQIDRINTGIEMIET